MSEIKKELVLLLNATSKILESLTEEQCKNILNGKGNIRYENIIEDGSIEKNEDFNIKLYVNKIEQFNNREEAYNYIKELNLKKADLVKIATELKIHLSKSDKKDTIVTKIIETTIGSRLRDEAIKKVSLKRNVK